MLKIVVTLLAVSSIATQQRKCAEFCEDCDIAYKCHACLKRKLIYGKCQTTSAIGNCLVFSEQGNCEICAPGYAVVFKSRIDANGLEQQQAVCAQNKIQNCQVTVQLDKTTGLGQQKKNQQVCIACAGGYPAVGSKTCGTFAKEETGLGQQVNHCLWGGRFYPSDKTYCFRCKDGYARNVQTGKCVKTAAVGCLSVTEAQRCNSCNIFEGYYQKTPSTCTK